MNRILFRMEIRRNLRSLLWWSAIISALVFFTMTFFGSFRQYQEQILGMIKLVPAAAVKARGFGNLEDIFSGLGFYAANNIVYMELLGSIFAMVLGAGIILKEEYGRTAEYLMSRPLSRQEIFYSKATLAFLNISLLNLITAAVGLLSLELFRSGPLNLKSFFVLTVYTYLLNLLFGAFGLLVAVVHRRARPVTFFCVGIVMVFYFLYTISRIQGVQGDWGYVSPFKWVSIEVLKTGYGLETWSILTFCLLTAASVILAGIIYKRKDILT